MSIIQKLKQNNFIGRGCGNYPTGQKWVNFQRCLETEEKGYIICNGSEGEPGVFKDGYLLENQMQQIIEGIQIALNNFENTTAYFYLRKDYYEYYKNKLTKLINNLPITLFKENGGYLFGEETVLINDIQGQYPIQPRLKPPYPTEKGLWGYPTLINNIETFYRVNQIQEGYYKNEKIYSISGDIKEPGICEMNEKATIKEILKQANSYPNFEFFVQAGGGASGEILLQEEIDQPVAGTGAIIVYNKKKTKPFDLMKKWAEFYMKNNCDKCVACREGIYRLYEMLKIGRKDKKLLEDILFTLKETSFCPLGRSITIPFEAVLNKLLK